MVYDKVRLGSSSLVVSFTLTVVIYFLPKNPFTISLKSSKGNCGLFIHFVILYIYSCLTKTPEKLNVD
ncbi:hypothetical protein H8356DRAFT_1417633 [Neocallimastix lanati (nom. inval.)]|nr:hypothetical protein H8356DRAFT_1417633 [Neocallimastix sp. JGI-2020a]